MRNESNEDVYYGDGSVWVTSRRLIYGGEEHALKGVRGAGVLTLRVADRLKIAYIGLPLSMIFAVLAVLRLASLDSNESAFHAVAVAFYAMVASVVVIELGVLIALPFINSKMSPDPVYAISVRYRLWSSIAAVSVDQTYIEQILGATHYALAHRNNPNGAVAPASVGQTAQIPSPVISGNSVYVGQAEYNLANIESTRLWASTRYGWPWVAHICTMIMLLLLMFAGDYSPEMLTLAIIGVFFVVFPAIFVCAIAALVSASSMTYMVQLTSNTGVRSIVYATKNRDEAKQFQQSIQQAMQGTYAVEHA
jgi:hypothetical protein